MDESLEAFVVRAHERGMDLDGVTRLLAAAGWREEEVAAAWCACVLEREVPPPPDGRGARVARVPVSPRDAFWQLLAFSALYTWVISLIVLSFQYVNLAFPDPGWESSAVGRDFVYTGIRWALASIVVAYPLFLWVWRVVLRDLAAHPEKARALVRRWLTYLSLFVGAITLVVDVITLVYFLFEGEITVRFLLKVLALFAVAGGVFLYLAATLRPETAPATPKEHAS